MSSVHPASKRLIAMTDCDVGIKINRGHEVLRAARDGVTCSSGLLSDAPDSFAGPRFPYHTRGHVRKLGIPYRYFAKDKWDIRFRHTSARSIVMKNGQLDLQRCHAQPAEPFP